MKKENPQTIKTGSAPQTGGSSAGNKGTTSTGDRTTPSGAGSGDQIPTGIGVGPPSNTASQIKNVGQNIGTDSDSNSDNHCGTTGIGGGTPLTAPHSVGSSVSAGDRGTPIGTPGIGHPGSVGSIGGPHSNDTATRSGTPSGAGGGIQRQLSSDGLERPPSMGSMGAGSCKDEGSIGGQLLNGAEGGGENNTSSSNVGSAICDNNATNNSHINNRTVAGQNTPDGCGLSENPGSTSSSGGGMIGQTNASHNLNPLSNGPPGSLDDGSGNTLTCGINNTASGASNLNNSNSNNHLNSSLEDMKPSNLGSSSNCSTPQHQVLNNLPNDTDSFLDAFDTKEGGMLTFAFYIR